MVTPTRPRVAPHKRPYNAMGKASGISDPETTVNCACQTREWLVTKPQQPQWPPVMSLGEESSTFWTSACFSIHPSPPGREWTLSVGKSSVPSPATQHMASHWIKGLSDVLRSTSSHFLLSSTLFSTRGVGDCAGCVMNSAGTMISGRNGMEVIFLEYKSNRISVEVTQKKLIDLHPPQYTDKSSLPGPSGVMKKRLIKSSCQKQPTLHLSGDVPQPLRRRGGGRTGLPGPGQALPCSSLVWDYSNFNTIRFLGLRLFPKLLCISTLHCAHIKITTEGSIRAR